jgi:hypothetical protein
LDDDVLLAHGDALAAVKRVAEPARTGNRAGELVNAGLSFSLPVKGENTLKNKKML